MAETFSSLATASDGYSDASESAARQLSVFSEAQRLLSHQELGTAAGDRPSDDRCLDTADMEAAERQMELMQAALPRQQQQQGSSDQPDQACQPDEAATDPLTMDEYAESLARMIADASLPMPLLVGLLGPRGSGKTHLIKAMLWKLKKICSFNCSNMGSHVRPNPVRWRYNLCGSTRCQCSFFCYLALIATVFATLVLGVVAFTIYASMVYTIGLDSSSSSNSSSAAVAAPPSYVAPALTTMPTPSVIAASSLSPNQVSQGIAIYDVLPILFSTKAPPRPPAVGKAVQKSLVEQESVMYPLYAAAVVVGVCLLVTILCCLVYCCSARSSDDDSASQTSDFWLHVRALLVMLLCETPAPPRPREIKRQEIEIIPVTFNAYEYAGNDMLWAGIVTTLFDQIEKSFGGWKVKFYRMFVRHTVPHMHDEHVVAALLPADDGEAGAASHHRHASDGSANECYRASASSGATVVEEVVAAGGEGRRTTGRSPHRPGQETSAGQWDVVVHSAKWRSIPYAIIAGNVIALLSLSILIIVLFAVKAGTADLASVEHAIQIAAGAIFGITALTQVQKIWALVKVLWSSQSNEVVQTTMKQAENPDYSKSLGFMHDVRRQVAKVTDFVKLMERLYRKRFRVLVVVDALDRCDLQKVVNVIEAVNVLLSDEESHFVTLLSVDHNSVNQALAGKVRGNNAQYMQQLFQVCFCMPEYGIEDIKLALNRGKAGGGGRTGTRTLLGSGYFEWQLSGESSASKGAAATGGKAQLGVPPSCPLKEHADRLQVESFEMKPLTTREHKDLERLRRKLCWKLTQVAVDELSRNSQLLPLSYKSVRDLRNVIFCTLCMWTRRRVKSTSLNIAQLEVQLAPLCRLFAYWIFLVEVWPYRCSWILHHVGVMEERVLGSVGKEAPSQRLAGHGAFDALKLSDLYGHVRPFVKTLDDWKYWISNDGDPDTFEIAVNQCPLTVRLAKQFLPFTTNLDRGIKKAISEHCNMHGDVQCTSCAAYPSPGDAKSA